MLLYFGIRFIVEYFTLCAFCLLLLAVDELEELLNVAVFANSRGVSPLSTVNNNYIWCFGDGVFFAVVFLLTIGLIEN